MVYLIIIIIIIIITPRDIKIGKEPKLGDLFLHRYLEHFETETDIFRKFLVEN